MTLSWILKRIIYVFVEDRNRGFEYYLNVNCFYHDFPPLRREL
jgi:hypothetical protein